MIDQIRQIAVFAKTVEAGSFRGAAKLLNLSPSVVSHHVAQLEQVFGTALLYRSTRRLSLTPDGERLMQSAKVMIAAVEDGLNALSARVAQPSGNLRVTLPAVFANSSIVDHIGAFTKEYPEIALSLSFSDLVQDVIGDGFDVAIRVGWLTNSRLVAKRLFDLERVVVATPAYLATRPAPRTPSDLADWDWFRLSQVDYDHVFQGKTGKHVKVRLNPRHGVDDAFALYRLLKAGLGLAAAPRFLAEDDIAAGEIKVVLPDWRLEPPGVYAVWPPNAPREGLTARFVKFLDEQCRKREITSAPTW